MASGTGRSSLGALLFDTSPSLLLIIVWKTGCPSWLVTVAGMAHLSSNLRIRWGGVIKHDGEYRGLEAGMWQGPEG